MKTKARPLKRTRLVKIKPLKKIGLIIFLILASVLALVAISINFSSFKEINDITPTPKNNYSEIQAINPIETSNINSAENLKPIELEMNQPERTSDGLKADSQEINAYSAIVSVIYDNGLKILNNSIFDRVHDQALNPPTDWLNISLNKKNNSFTVTCRRDFWLKDCLGGALSRLEAGSSCSRNVIKDRKNTLSLECERLKN